MSKQKNQPSGQKHEPLPAPEHLSEKSKNLWTMLVQERVTSVPRQMLLIAGLEALDRSEEARLAIQQQGLVNTTQSTGAVHLNPPVKVERESKNLFAKIWSQLKLDTPAGERWTF